MRLALVASDGPRAQEARHALADAHDWVAPEEAEALVVLGGDGYMLHVLHGMLDNDRVIPAFGVNHGTVGFLMNKPRSSRHLIERIEKAKPISITPLKMTAVTNAGTEHSFHAINEVSLLRETRQTAKLEVRVNDKLRMPELSCDGVLVATPAGSTAYNLSAHGPILPLDSKLLALTPISPFRPRRWRGAILPEKSRVTFTVLQPDKRPVAAVADQKEVRDISEVRVAVAHDRKLTLLFDRASSLDERIFAEQFQV
ncbi:NAD kinase [Novosphingobium marinum]|uniref:NAD kinase n=1 Tax=Novosphingobium marinum TaxID=1514948 RepID=A0A7Z0BTW0_9SPHN|nr:NAD kinase [Novosphingobium marinum]NYH94518.1 NAD+ kinase [Novosphingobium marinum]GGC22949.1 NAD kinase [Novosphingobium marinum]